MDAKLIMNRRKKVTLLTGTKFLFSDFRRRKQTLMADKNGSMSLKRSMQTWRWMNNKVLFRPCSQCSPWARPSFTYRLRCYVTVNCKLCLFCGLRWLSIVLYCWLRCRLRCWLRRRLRCRCSAIAVLLRCHCSFNAFIFPDHCVVI